MDFEFLLLLIALILFILAAFGVNARNVNLTAAGLAFLVLSMML